jgi:hypothetical protein
MPAFEIRRSATSLDVSLTVFVEEIYNFIKYVFELQISDLFRIPPKLLF